MNHTKEPWQHHLGQLFVTDEKGQFILGQCNTNFPELSHANASRIVFCVNAMAGIGEGSVLQCYDSLGSVKIHIVNQQLQIFNLTKQRDKLLEALRGFVEHGTCFDDDDFEHALAAIAMVESGEESKAFSAPPVF